MSPPMPGQYQGNYDHDDYGYESYNNNLPAQPKQQKTIEQTYQKKTQLEHILLRPDTYIGSVQPINEKMWVVKEEKIVQRDITYVPGFFKIFDEILVNAADNKQRDAKMNEIRISIDQENNEIQIRNNGKGIQVEWHKEQKMYVPTLIFGHLLTSSNFDDAEQKVTGGRNGFGAKLCNVFSAKFTVETSCRESGKQFKQTWRNNMSDTSEPEISKAAQKDFTCVTWSADLSKFKGMRSLDDDIISLLSRRAYDIAASTNGVTIYLNDNKIPIRNFKEYVTLFLQGQTFNGAPITPVIEKFGDRWEVAVAPSDHGFQQMSFVNSIATTKGGKHIDHVYGLVQNVIVEEYNKKKKKGEADIKNSIIKNHTWILVNCLIVNPTFDSQTKENMTLVQSKFGSKCVLDDKFKAKILKLGIQQAVKNFSKFKEDQSLATKQSGKKTNKLKNMEKLNDAHNAGSRFSLGCTLILTEGDSAKTLAVAGVGNLDDKAKDNFGIYPLKGKVLNVREASTQQIMQNKEISELVKIVGLTYKKKYRNEEDMKSLRYGKIMIMTDQDQDGSHIKGLLINFIQHNWPELLQRNFLEEFITPIVKVTKGNVSHSFYSMPEFSEWKDANKQDWHKYTIKYYKGLGTSTSNEAKEYFADMKRHRIQFSYIGQEDDNNIDLAFSKKKIEERKDWLRKWMNETKERKLRGLQEEYIYQSNTQSITYSDFINKELILFSNSDNERSIPSLVDGFKPGQRKVIFTCLKKNQIKDIKVAQLAGAVGEKSAYHHGEASLMGTIVNLAQNYVGSNNINLLKPIGQFGTRMKGGSDSASPRYIFTALSSLTRHIFNASDDPLLKSNKDDGKTIEPEWYVPIIPMVLVNGAEGIGTGWSTKVPNYNPRDIVEKIKQLLTTGCTWRDLKPMVPWYKNFLGEIEALGNEKFVVSGVVSDLNDGRHVEITELPIGTWTDNYDKKTLEVMSNEETTSKDKSGKDQTKKKEKEIEDHRNYSTDTTVKFHVTMTDTQMRKAMSKAYEYFKLQTTISTSSMVLFDKDRVLKRYEDVREILGEFFEVRLEFYVKRKQFLEGKAAAEARKLSNQARFIKEKCDRLIVVENKKKHDIVQLLKNKGYDPDPVARWKQSVEEEQEEEIVNDENLVKDEKEEKSEFDYIMNMKLWSLTKEKQDELLKEEKKKKEELEVLRRTTKEQMWMKDLEEFLTELDKVEKKQREEDEKDMKKSMQGKGGKRQGKFDKSYTSSQSTKISATISDNMQKKVQQASAAKERKANKNKSLNTGGDVGMDVLNNSNSNDSFEASMDMDSPFQPKRSFGQISSSLNSSQWQVDGMPPKPEKSRKTNASYFNTFSDSDDNNDIEPLEPREQSSRRAAQPKTVQYTEDSDDDLEEIPNENESGQDKIARMLKSTQGKQNRFAANNKPVNRDQDSDAIVELTDEEED